MMGFVDLVDFVLVTDLHLVDSSVVEFFAKLLGTDAV